MTPLPTPTLYTDALAGSDMADHDGANFSGYFVSPG